MKTPQQIIDSLPEGNRKRACVALTQIGLTDDRLWQEIQDGDWQTVSIMLAGSLTALPAVVDILADMIWEG